ncbi:MAG TPA: C1 family peptidase [Xanthobacteraceae bacterium]|nr:C1 family peptidase [Xanthobacteraceae bacterium]
MRIIAAPIGLCAFLAFSPAKAQDTVVHTLGAIAPTRDQIKSFPKASVPKFREALPAKVDLSANMPPIGDQGGMGACVAWSAGYGLRSYYLKKNAKADISKPENVPSPAYIFNHGSAMDQPNVPCAKRGMLISIALETLKGGVVSAAEMPYNDKTCGPPPDLEMQSRAKKFRIDGWAFVDPDDFTAIKTSLANGDPVVFGMQVSADDLSKFGDPKKSKVDGVYKRNPNAATDGGHAEVLIGYDDSKQAFRVQNSWGPDWGDHGRFWLSYETFKSDATDAYIVRVGADQ